MGVLNLFKKGKKEAKATDNNANGSSGSLSKEDIFKMILEQQAQRAPSEHFASGAVFDISRQSRDIFWDVLRSNNAMALNQLFAKAYMMFLQHPEYVGFTSQMVNQNANDTNPAEWNADIFKLSSGTYAALLFMPVRNNSIAARIVGIIFGDNGDGYYYCMLNRNESIPSSVYRNKAMLGISNIGEVKGLGFELMNSFLSIIKSDYSK